MKAVGDAPVTPRLTPRRRFVYACITVAAAFAAASIVLLATDVYLHHRVQNLGGVNVWGYRGPVVGAKKPGERRIVVLGGSTAFGFGVAYNETFPAYLEQLLNEQAGGSSQYSVVNLGAPGQGAFSFRFDLSDYAYLQYDVVVLYEGYNDLGSHDMPEAVPPRFGPNYLLWRRQSPVFRTTGYLPVLPLVFREKAMALRAGGDLDAAYRGRVTFRPGLATRAGAAALETVAAIATQVGETLGNLSSDVGSVEREPADVESWRFYVTNLIAGVEAARGRGAKVIVVTQPYGSDTHIAQQQALAAALRARYKDERSVIYTNLGRLLNIRDREVAFDGLHLVATANRRVAEQLVAPVLELFR